ncbi:MAG: ribosome small subunit-dependent GTPase A [Clostridia bacterium]|nr:ribosome small subunit-dependent GTPase A [Clostridia bacterium]
MNKLNGIILKGIGGFYYVEAADAVYECKAKGVFRKEGIKPVAGDRVTVSVSDDMTGTLDDILERKNYLERPPVANIDILAVVSSAAKPLPNLIINDKMIAMAEKRSIEPVVIFTKTDLADVSEMAASYIKAGFRTFLFSPEGGDEDGLKKLISGKVTAFCGNSGVGKSTLINRLCPGVSLQTGEISDKLGRGRHTTRQAELIPFENGYIIDTAGFSTVNMLQGEAFLAEDLPYYFREFVPYLTKCRFSTCTHVADNGCAVCEAVKNGEISRLRHESYAELYKEIKDLKKWQI